MTQPPDSAPAEAGEWVEQLTTVRVASFRVQEWWDRMVAVVRAANDVEQNHPSVTGWINAEDDDQELCTTCEDYVFNCTARDALTNALDALRSAVTQEDHS